jgi:serine/threonine protein kinase
METTQPIKVLGFTADRPPQSAEPEFTVQVAEPLAVESPPAGDRSITDASALRAGDVLAGRYVVLEQVDHRGMGLVYKALDRHRERAGSPVPWVALKFASATGRDSAEMSACLRQEFLKLAQLNHPNVVSVFDLACHDGLDFMVMEWLDGETLASVLAQIRSKRIALEKATDIIRNAARALAHAHDLGIVHGDIKPSNIFLAGSRAIKLLDFGSSAKSTSDDGESERNWATRAYASCELLQGRMPQPSDDVFALGVTAYCLLSGERPFGDLDALAAREQGLAPKPLPADAQEYWPAVAHALRFDAIDRAGGAKVFLQEFDEPAVDPAPLDRPSPAVATGALAATLLASLAWWWVQSTGGWPAGAQDTANAALAGGRFVVPAPGSAPDGSSTVLPSQPAASLLPTNEPAVASAPELLAERNAAKELDALLSGIDERILAERLTVPEGDSALDLLRQARALAPDERAVELMADRIMTALLFQALFAISNGSLDDAARFIDAAKGMGTKHLALARAEYELAKARRQALADRAAR